MVAVHQLDVLGGDVGPHSGSGLGLPAAFVGRDADLDALTALAGRPGTRWVTVTGRSGIGKSCLLRSLVERLRANGRLPAGAPATGVLWVDAHGVRPDERALDRLPTSRRRLERAAVRHRRAARGTAGLIVASPG